MTLKRNLIAMIPAVTITERGCKGKILNRWVR